MNRVKSPAFRPIQGISLFSSKGRLMERISDIVDDINKLLVIVVLSVMAVVVFLQVIFRYALHLPLFWTEEFARYCLVWASLLGAGIAFKRGEHIAVTIFTDRFLPGRKFVFAAFLVDVFILIILVVMLWGGVTLVMLTRMQTSPALRIPMAIPYLAIPIGSIIMIVHLVAIFYQRLLLGGYIKAKIRLKLATVTPKDHAYNAGAEEFARLISEKTGGAVDILVYPGGKLGQGEEEVLKGLQMGTIDLAVVSTGPLNTFSLEIGVLDFPFLFRNSEHVDKVLDGPIGSDLLEGLEKMKGLAFMENGFRHFTTATRPIIKPQDFRNLKLRIMDNPIHLASVRELGAEPAPMSWGEEVLTALRTKTIDGQENPVAIIHANEMDKIQNHLSLTGHFYSSAPLCMNKTKFDALKPQWQTLFMETAREAAVFERKIIRKEEKNQLKELKNMGMEIHEIDSQLFVDAVKPVYSSYLSKYPAWMAVEQKIRAIS
jgi:tripartite ATP-independent transporter DctP family solute receptor